MNGKKGSGKTDKYLKGWTNRWKKEGKMDG